jgi:hypothetical protein
MHRFGGNVYLDAADTLGLSQRAFNGVLAMLA